MLNVTDRIFLKKNTKKTFKKIRNEIISNYFNILETLDYYKKIDYKENIKKSIKRDLDELFKRRESQEISSYENINEVFALFTKSRYSKV